MEEFVGKVWHRLVTRSSHDRFPKAAVLLQDIRKPVGVFFRALGGDGALRIEACSGSENTARRNWLQRLAGTHRQVELSWRNNEALYLPLTIDIFPSAALNRDLYFWLAGLAAVDVAQTKSWFAYNQWLTCKVLQQFPGLRRRYERLVKAHVVQRPNPDTLPDGEAAQERAIQEALCHPGGVTELPTSLRTPHPVVLWLHPNPPRPPAADRPDVDAGNEHAGEGESRQVEQDRRHQAERVDMPDGKRGLLMYRFETIFSWAEYIKVDRCTDENEDLDDAAAAADDLDVISVARDSRATAKRLRFDLDLPAAAYDDIPLGDGILLPEWDYRKSCLIPEHCCVQPMLAAQPEPAELPLHLRATARRLRAQFEALIPMRIWHRAQQDGSEIDLEAFLQYNAERLRGRAVAEQGVYRDFRGGGRDLACLLLADLSLSTDAWVSNEARVIDVVRDSLFLFSEALTATGDCFALYGFSSRHRSHVRFHVLKEFGESCNAITRGRIQAVKPGFYTRMGAAIRHATELLGQQPSNQRLLLLLTDGKPNDLDHYEGRYGVEDTRMALIEARRQGVQPFCVTIDERAGDYLPYLFGSSGYVVIRKPSQLPRELPLLYARLTQTQ
jgi:nitric oxide reductase NorD protein